MSTTWNHFSPFADATWRVMSFLTLGLEGKAVIEIRASKNGLAMKLSGSVVARGKDARELCDNFDRFMEQKRAVIEEAKAQLARIERKVKLVRAEAKPLPPEGGQAAAQPKEHHAAGVMHRPVTTAQRARPARAGAQP